jgi:hypothetical protein
VDLNHKHIITAGILSPLIAQDEHYDGLAIPELRDPKECMCKAYKSKTIF